MESNMVASNKHISVDAVVYKERLIFIWKDNNIDLYQINVKKSIFLHAANCRIKKDKIDAF